MWLNLDEKLFNEAVAEGRTDVAIHMVREAMARTAPGPHDQAYRDQVNVIEGELECDDDAVVSMSDDLGAYVMTWTWVSDLEAGLEKECPDCGEIVSLRALECDCGSVFGDVLNAQA